MSTSTDFYYSQMTIVVAALEDPILAEWRLEDMDCELSGEPEPITIEAE